MLERAAATQPTGEDDGGEHDHMDAPAPAALPRHWAGRAPPSSKEGLFGLLLSSIMRAGGRLRADGGVDFPGEIRADLMKDPIQCGRMS